MECWATSPPSTSTREARSCDGNKVFELVLAAFDVYALLVLLPIFATDLVRNGPGNYFGLAISACAHSYHITILCSTVCRYVAVYHPFKFNTFFDKWRPYMLGLILAVTVLMFSRTLLLAEILEVERSNLYYIDITLLTVTSFSATAVLFTVIVIKLKKQNLVTTAPQSAPVHVEMGENSAEGAGGHTTSRKTHVIAVETFGAVSLCFLASYVIGYMTSFRLLPREANFLYFVNHFCNPVIYFLFNKDFRAKFEEIVKIK